jgi:1,4-dihydroxy-2-naphthoate octaprenyltransferase
MEYVTLTREDPDFQTHLLGTFSKNRRALPVETYSPDTVRERVTFQLMDVGKLDIPPWWNIYFRSCRPELLVLTLGPAIAAWLSHRESFSRWMVQSSWSAVMGLIFLHTAMFLFNDVQDHLRGRDRINRRRGSRVIQKGWVPAYVMRRWAWVNFGLAAVFAFPAFLNAPWAVTSIGLAAGLSLLVFQKNLATRLGLCDLSLLLLFGPLLTMGVASASFGRTGWTDVILGLVFGASTLWTFQVRQFGDLVRAKPEDFHTFLAFFEFDRARSIAVAEGLLLLGAHFLAGLALRLPSLAMALIPIAGLPLLITLYRLRKAASPLSSDMIGLPRSAVLSYMTMTVWWLISLGVLCL